MTDREEMHEQKRNLNTHLIFPPFHRLTLPVFEWDLSGKRENIEDQRF